MSVDRVKVDLRKTLKKNLEKLLNDKNKKANLDLKISYEFYKLLNVLIQQNISTSHEHLLTIGTFASMAQEPRWWLDDKVWKQKMRNHWRWSQVFISGTTVKEQALNVSNEDDELIFLNVQSHQKWLDDLDNKRVPLRFESKKISLNYFDVHEQVNPQFVLTPGLGFDELGGRLGRGKAFYDRYFETHKTAKKIGIAYECQVLKRPDVVPRNDWDHAVDYLITEDGLRIF